MTGLLLKENFDKIIQGKLNEKFPQEKSHTKHFQSIKISQTKFTSPILALSFVSRLKTEIPRKSEILFLFNEISFLLLKLNHVYDSQTFRRKLKKKSLFRID